MKNNPHIVGKCFKCGESFNILQIAEKVKGLDFNEAVKTCAELAGVHIGSNDSYSTKKTKAAPTVKSENKPAEPPKNFTDYYNICGAALLDPKNIKAMDYLKSRGIGDLLIAHFQIGYDTSNNTIIIPHDKSFYTARTINQNGNRFTSNPKGSHVTLFNAAALNNPDNFIFVTEGVFDALSLIKIGFQAVAVGGVTNYKTLIRALDSVDDKPKFIILFDSDKAGRDNSINLEKALAETKAFSINETLPLIDGNEKTDTNDWLIHNEDELRKIAVQLVSTAQEKYSNWTAAMDAIKKSKMLPGVNFEYEIPEGYELDLDGLYVQTRKDELKRISNPIIVSKLVENVDEGIYKTALACFTGGKWCYSPAVDNDIVATKTKITTLAKYGINITSTTAGAIVDYIQRFIDTNRETIPKAQSVSRTGWRGDDFVYLENGGKFELDDTIRQQARFFTSKGDKEAVLPLIKKLKEIDNFNIGLGAALAAPLVSIVGGENIVLHFYGLAGCGKTTLSKAVASLFVNPFVTGALPSANSTASGLEYLFNGRRDLPVFVEDIGAVDQLDRRTQAVMKNLPYQFGNGVGRMRAKAQGGNRETVEFSGALITNDEKPLTSDNSKGGAKRRVIEIECAKDMIAPKLAGEIDDVIRENYGLFGRDWIEYIKSHKSEIQEKCKEIRHRFFETSYIYKVPRHIDQMSTIATALIFFNKFAEFEGSELDDNDNGFTDTVTDMNEFKCCGRIIDQLPFNNDIADFERVKPIIRDWILQNIKKFIDDSNYDETIPVNLNGNGVNSYEIFGIVKAKFFGVYPAIFNKMLANEGFSPEMIIKQLIDDDYLIHDKGRKDKKIRTNDEKSTYVIAIPKDKVYEKEN